MFCRASLALTVLAVPAFVVLGSQAAASGAPVASVNAPTWWNGPCDSVHWDEMATYAGWSGPGAHPLGASYLGVQVCGPRPAVDGAPDVTWTRNGWGAYEWECVELAMRFMVQIYGVQPYSANGVDVVANYRPSDGGGLVKIANGTVGEAPQPGDIISFSDGGEGHVVVVASSDVRRLRERVDHGPVPERHRRWLAHARCHQLVGRRLQHLHRARMAP
jgi:hypothetical protein